MTDIATIVREGSYPVATVLRELEQALHEPGAAILEAPPGAGKSTIIPLYLDERNVAQGNKIVMLQPRRLAARMVAMRMADLRGERVGQSVGYAVRFERRVSAATRIEVVTEGLLTRRLQRDPELHGIGLIIFDEVHERSLDLDLALALTQDVRTSLRPDLKVVTMSATLSGMMTAMAPDHPMATMPRLRTEGRSFPITVHHRGEEETDDPPARAADACIEALRAGESGILVFLPGAREIRRCERLVRDRLARGEPVDMMPLYGDLGPETQARAIASAPAGRQKIVLATNIAETSLTIEGITAVIDSGLVRRQRHSASNGMTRLETVRTSRASSDQRAGRAGRVAPGSCVRLWPQATHAARPALDQPEIERADLAAMLLQLYAWGTANPGSLSWITPPPEAAVERARSILRDLELVDESGQLSVLGRMSADLPLHPRLSRMVLACKDTRLEATARSVAALLEARDPWRERREVDLGEKLRWWCAGTPGDAAALRELGSAFKQLSRYVNSGTEGTPNCNEVGSVLVRAFPDRVARATAAGSPRYKLIDGGHASLPRDHAMIGTEWLVIAELEIGERGEAMIRVAARASLADIQDCLGHRCGQRQQVFYDQSTRRIRAEETLTLGAITLESRALEEPSRELVIDALMWALELEGIRLLRWSARARSLHARLCWAIEAGAKDLPIDVERELPIRVREQLAGMTTLEPSLGTLQAIEVETLIMSMIGWDQIARFETLLPERIELPSGKRLAIAYDREGPRISSRLQDFFGMTTQPCVLDGAVAVRIELLSPAGRPVQVTADIASFWSGSYAQVRKEMRGRYPKHAWPEDPATRVRPSR